MRYEKLMRKYPLIKKIIPAIEGTKEIDKTVGFYTSKISREDNKEKLEQWITYLAEKDTKIAVNTINKLSRITDEEKEKLVSIVTTYIQESKTNRLMLQSLMLAYLRLRYFKEAGELYTKIKFKNKKPSVYIHKDKLGDLEEYIKDKNVGTLKTNIVILHNINRLRKFRPETEDDNLEELFQNIIKWERTDLEYGIEKINNRITEYINFLNENAQFLKDNNIGYLNCKLDIGSFDTMYLVQIKLKYQRKKIKKKQDAKFDFIIEEMDKVIDYIDNQKIVLYEIRSKNIQEFINQNIDLIPQDEMPNEQEKHLNRILYKKILIKKYFNIENVTKLNKLDYILFNNEVMQDLWNESEYDIMLQYIHIVQKSYNYSYIEQFVKYVKPADKKSNKEIIDKILNWFFEKNQLVNALYFLKNIGTEKYSDYIPNDKSLFEYIQILHNEDSGLKSLSVQESLFFEANNKQHIDKITILENWLKYIDNNYEINDNITKHQMLVILEILDIDIYYFQKSEYIKNKFEILIGEDDIERTLHSHLNTDEHKANIEKIIKIFNKLIEDDSSIEEKIKYLKQLEKINCFKYETSETEITQNMDGEEKRELKTDSMIIFMKLIENIQKKETENIIFLYMNTHIKYYLAIEDFIKALIEHDFEHVIKYINKYEFYAFIRKTNGNVYRLKIRNAYNDNRTIIREDEFQKSSKGRKAVYKVTIGGYNYMYNNLIIKNIYLVNGQNSIISEMIQKYMDYYSNTKITKLEDIERSEIEKDLYSIIKFQIDLLADLCDKTKREKIFSKMKADYINPYRFLNKEELMECNDVNEEIERITQNAIFAKRLKTLFFDKVKSIYKELINDGNFKIKNVIYFYMNTATRYILNLNEFYELLDIKHKNSLYVLFEKYAILFKRKDNSKRISGAIQIDFDNFMIVKGILIPLENGVYKTCLIRKVSKDGNIEVVGIEDTSITYESNLFEELNTALKQYLESETDDDFSRILGCGTIPEFENDEFIDKQDIEQFVQYKLLYYQIIKKIVSNIKTLKKFLDALGENNCWKINSDQGWIIGKIKKETELVLKIFLEQAKEADLDTIFYCYNNTYFKKVLQLDDFLRTVYRYNEEGRNSLKHSGIADISKYNIQFGATLKKNPNYENMEKKYSIVEISSLLKPINVLIFNSHHRVIDEKELPDYVHLKILSYNIEQNIIIAKYLDNRNNKYELQDLNKILRTFKRTENRLVLKKIKKLNNSIKFIKDEDEEYQKEIQEYKQNYYEIILKFANKLSNISRFIDYLGDTNYWKQERELKWHIIKDKKINKTIEVFLETTKNSYIDEILFCYQNTFLKDVIQLDDLLDFIMKNNNREMDRIKRNDIEMYYLGEYNLNFKAWLNKKNENNDLKSKYTSVMAEGYSHPMRICLLTKEDLSSIPEYLHLKPISYNIKNRRINVIIVNEKEGDNAKNNE